MHLDGPPDLAGKLRKDVRKLARGDDAMEQGLDELQVNAHVNAEVPGAGDELSCRDDLVPVMQEARRTCAEGVDAIGEGESLAAVCDGERVREALWLWRELDPHRGLDAGEKVLLLGRVGHRPYGLLAIRSVAHATTSSVWP